MLEAAMDVFWSGGYGTSVQQVVERTGVQRQSLYGAFGDKDGLFLRALARYAEGSREVAAALAGPGPVLSGLRLVLASAVEVARQQPGRGCMLGDTVAELVPAHPGATAVARGAYADLRGLFTEALERGRASGEVRDDQAVEDQATSLLAAMQGLRLISRAEPDPGRLAGAVDVVIAPGGDGRPAAIAPGARRSAPRGGRRPPG